MMVERQSGDNSPITLQKGLLVMPHLAQYCLSAVIAGIIAGGGVLLASGITDTGFSSKGVWIAGITGALAMLKDLQAFLQPPPGQ